MLFFPAKWSAHRLIHDHGPRPLVPAVVARRSLAQLVACLTTGLLLSVGGSQQAMAESLWRQLIPQKKVSADPQGDYTLTERHGPWLVMATTFSGDEGHDQARELVLELRKRYSLTAFVHRMSFDHSGPAPGRGIDRYGAPLRTRYARDGKVTEHAVLVGGFATADDPGLQQLLKRVKELRPKSLVERSPQESAQSFAQLREYQNRIRESRTKQGRRGPLGRAFVTRNPLLPKEYFVPKGVDKFVAKLNDGIEYSLLNCPGKYSVKVATFRGRSALQTSQGNSQLGKGSSGEEHPLAQAAANAHRLTVALRMLGAEQGEGWEAYEFHDRFESYVTVGSFDKVTRRLPNGRVVPSRDVQIIMQTFGSSANNNHFRGNPNVSSRDLHSSLERFKNHDRLRSKLGVGGHGDLGRQLQANHKHLLTIPFDVHPSVIEAPKKSISRSYAKR